MLSQENKDVLLHLRIPFSFFLMPVFFFGISEGVSAMPDAVAAFVALHLFIYPASNGYNSYMDQDEGPIGGLEHPPPASRRLYYTTIVVDLLGIAIAAAAAWQLAVLVLGYIGFSKAYSWRGIRLKGYPVLGWISVAFFQGGYTYMLASMAAQANYSLGTWLTKEHFCALLFATLMIGASYPLTQVYQHAEDRERGDKTISVLLGVQGTFRLSAVLFALSGALAAYYFLQWYSAVHLAVFGICMLPVLFYFGRWWKRVADDAAQAAYRPAMNMNRIASTCTSMCFLILWWLNSRPEALGMLGVGDT